MAKVEKFEELRIWRWRGNYVRRFIAIQNLCLGSLMLDLYNKYVQLQGV